MSLTTRQQELYYLWSQGPEELANSLLYEGFPHSAHLPAIVDGDREQKVHLSMFLAASIVEYSSLCNPWNDVKPLAREEFAVPTDIMSTVACLALNPSQYAEKLLNKQFHTSMKWKLGTAAFEMSDLFSRIHMITAKNIPLGNEVLCYERLSRRINGGNFRGRVSAVHAAHWLVEFAVRERGLSYKVGNMISNYVRGGMYFPHPLPVRYSLQRDKNAMHSGYIDGLRQRLFLNFG